MSTPYQLNAAELAWEKDSPRSTLYDDIYWQHGLAVEEKRSVFLTTFVEQQAGRLGAGNARTQYASCAELGFGFGVNCLLTCGYWHATHADARLDYIGFEKHPVSQADLRRQLSRLNLPLAERLIDSWPRALAGTHVIWLTPRIRLLLVLDNAAQGLGELDAQVDTWYLDGFAPATNPEIWAAGIYPAMFDRSRPGALVATYSAAGQVRRGLEAAGFQVKKVPGFDSKRERLQARKPGNWQPNRVQHGRVAIVGAGLAGHFCAEALARRGLEPILIDKGFGNSRASAPSRIPQLAVYPLLATQPETRHRFSLLASQYMKSCPGFVPCGLRFYPRDTGHSQAGANQPGSTAAERRQKESERLQRIGEHFSDDFIAWRGDHLWFADAGWWGLEAFRQAAGLDRLCEQVQADVTAMQLTDAGWALQGEHLQPGTAKTDSSPYSSSQGKSSQNSYLQNSSSQTNSLQNSSSQTSSSQSKLGRVSSEGQLLHADQLIIATGADRRLLGSKPEIRMVRGQALSLEVEGLGLDSVITGPVTLFPEAGGRLVISGTYTRGSSLEIDAGDTAQLLAAARQFLSDHGTGLSRSQAEANSFADKRLGASSLEAQNLDANFLAAKSLDASFLDSQHLDPEKMEVWVGIRAASIDRMPIVDAMPPWQDSSASLESAASWQTGPYLSLAYGSRGATHARLGAEYLVSKMLGEASPLGKSMGAMLAATRFKNS